MRISTFPRGARRRSAQTAVLAALAVGALALSACQPASGPVAGGQPTTPATDTAAPVPSASTSPDAGAPKPANPPAGPAAKGLKPALSGTGYVDQKALTDLRGWAPQIQVTWNDMRTANAGSEKFAQEQRDAKAQGFGDVKPNAVTWYGMTKLYSVESTKASGWKGALAVNFPMWATGESAAQCSQGVNDKYRKQIAEGLKTKWGPDAWIDLGWEGNSGYEDTQGMSVSKPADWKACWNNWYKIIKAVSPDFKVVWVANIDGINNVLDYFPDKGFVDAAGADLYGHNDKGKLYALDARKGAGPLGIRAWRDEVAKRGLPFAVPEWAPVNNGADWASGDSAEYIQQMRDLFVETAKSPTGLAFEALFDGGKDYDCAFSMLPAATGCTKNPKSAAKYAELWKAGPYKTA